MKTLFCLLICLPSLIWAQAPYRSELSLQFINLGLGPQFEYAWGQRSSTALAYTTDYQRIGEGQEVWGGSIQLHYKYRLGGMEAPREIRSGLIFSLFYEYGFRRALEYYKEEMLYESSAFGLLTGYRLLPGRKERFSFSVMLGAKYEIPHLNIPEWYNRGSFPFSLVGFRPQIAVGIGFRTLKSKQHE